MHSISLYVACAGDGSVMNIAVDLQSAVASAGASLASSSLPTDVAYVTAAVTVATAGSEPQPTARCVFHCMWRWALVSPGGVAPNRMVCVSASVNLPLHHKVQKFSGTGLAGWSRKKGH